MDAQPRLAENEQPWVVAVLLRDGSSIADDLQGISQPSKKEQREHCHARCAEIAHERMRLRQSFAGQLRGSCKLSAQAADVQAEHLILLRERSALGLRGQGSKSRRILLVPRAVEQSPDRGHESGAKSQSGILRALAHT